MKDFKELRILAVPSDCSEDSMNPYQTLLSQGLVNQEIIVENWPYYEGKFPIYKAAVARKKTFDIVHIHWIYFYLSGRNKSEYFLSCFSFLLDVLITKWSGLKIVWTIHNSISHETNFPDLELWTRRQFIKLVDKVICLNQMTLEIIAKEYQFNPAKAVIIPHGHYRDVYQKPVDLMSARQELGLPETGRLYLNLGLLRPYKGIEKILRVWQENQDIFANDTLLIAGKPWDKKYAETLQNLAKGMEKVIIISEFIDKHKLHLYFSAANVVVLPFKKILNSGSLILAMSFGKPFIAPRLGGLLEVVGESDELLYDPEDDAGLLKAMRKSTQIDLEQLSQLIVKECDRLDWDSIAQKTVDVYRSVL